MSGHSKWSTIKRRKAAQDARKGKIFTRLIREIMVAAREGGGDPGANAKLRTAIDTARAANMPLDNIERAIKKGTGELPGVHYEAATYEGYGPGGVAIFVEVLSDNRNRTVADVRHIFTRFGGNLGAAGCVAWMFELKGQLYVDARRYDEETTLTVALDCGAEDLARDEDSFVVTTSLEDFASVRGCLGAKGIQVQEAEIAPVPKSYVRVEAKDAERLLKMMEALEEHDDVQRVSSNFDIPSEILAQISGS